MEERRPFFTAALVGHLALRAGAFTACAAAVMGLHCAVTGYPPSTPAVAAVVGAVFGLVTLAPLLVEALARRRAPSLRRDLVAALSAGALAFLVEFVAVLQAAYALGVTQAGSLEAGQHEAVRQAAQLPDTSSFLAVIFSGAAVMYGVAVWSALRPLRSPLRDALLVAGVGAAAEATALSANGLFDLWPNDSRLSVLLVGGGGGAYALARALAARVAPLPMEG